MSELNFVGDEFLSGSPMGNREKLRRGYDGEKINVSSFVEKSHLEVLPNQIEKKTKSY